MTKRNELIRNLLANVTQSNLVETTNQIRAIYASTKEGQEGTAARKQGLSLKANPYPVRPRKNWLRNWNWNSGWHSA